MLKLSNLTKYYGNVKGIEDLSLTVEKGEIFGFIGPNGAGKSTTIRCIMNLIRKDQGQIFIDNEEITPDSFTYKENIGYLPGELHLYDDLNVLEMIEYSASFYTKDSLKKAKSLAKRLKLDLKKNIEDLSLGNQKKLGIVLALMHNPKLIILDEPTSSLDPLIQEEFYQILKEEQANGKTIFLSSHVLSEIKKICNRVGILKEGHLIAVENIEELENQNYLNVYIESAELTEIAKVLNVQIHNQKFIYRGPVNKLLKQLSKFTINKILITEPEIEEIFINYYKEDL